MLTTTTPTGTVRVILDDTGRPVGRLTFNGRTWRASRRLGTTEDVRRYATGFRTEAAALRFVEAGAR